MDDNKVKRGEIYWYDFGEDSGSVQQGLRPALVVQADNINVHSPTVIIAAITTANKAMHLPTHIFIGENFGLTQPSTVMLEQLRTANQDALGPYIGLVNEPHIWKAIDMGMKKALGLWHYQMPRDEVRCLCVSCLHEYMHTNSYVISRLDPFQRNKEPCDKCGKAGYDYTLREKRRMQK